VVIWHIKRRKVHTVRLVGKAIEEAKVTVAIK